LWSLATSKIFFHAAADALRSELGLQEIICSGIKSAQTGTAPVCEQNLQNVAAAQEVVG